MNTCEPSEVYALSQKLIAAEREIAMLTKQIITKDALISMLANSLETATKKPRHHREQYNNVR
jgi:hypothetical protein